jgi:hypothetical protein
LVLTECSNLQAIETLGRASSAPDDEGAQARCAKCRNGNAGQQATPLDIHRQHIGNEHAQQAGEAIMSGSLVLITGWMLVVAATATLLTYRLLLRHYDRQVLRFEQDSPNPLHAALQNRMTVIDRWGVSLTIGIVLYTVLFLVYLLYQSLESVAQALLHLLSYI